MELRLQEIEDPIIRENFERVKSDVESFPFLKGKWRFVEIVFTGAVTNYQYPHGLAFIPKDVIQTSITGAGSLTWNYATFSRTHLDITTTGACTVRAFVGTYFERGNR
jgi:hypothetical protein